MIDTRGDTLYHVKRKKTWLEMGNLSKKGLVFHFTKSNCSHNLFPSWKYEFCQLEERSPIQTEQLHLPINTIGHGRKSQNKRGTGPWHCSVNYRMKYLNTKRNYLIWWPKKTNNKTDLTPKQTTKTDPGLQWCDVCPLYTHKAAKGALIHSWKDSPNKCTYPPGWVTFVKKLQWPAV